MNETEIQRDMWSKAYDWVETWIPVVAPMMGVVLGLLSAILLAVTMTMVVPGKHISNQSDFHILIFTLATMGVGIIGVGIANVLVNVFGEYNG